MKKANIPIITLEQFKEYPEHIRFINENIAILFDITEKINIVEETIKLDCFLFVFCQKGSLTIFINGKQYVIHKDYCAILPPNTLICKRVVGKSFNVKIAVASRSFLSHTIGLTKQSWDIMSYLYSHPIHPVDRNRSYKMYLYKELLMTLVQEKPHAYSNETFRLHFAGMFCEILASIHKIIPDEARSDVNRNRYSLITRDFMELVNADDGTHRSVSYYADKLCYTSKHLSHVVKHVLGKSPLQIINDHAIKEIKYKLRLSELSMKEIADYFNFPNASFFSKYVKTHTGMTPSEYRSLKKEE